ncbi:MAG: sigma-70 family RNA polymerase sigma factor [Pirellulales bacterium]|nr:sigma-70 family RNA polymerase sigma factor [Pirellulales bacterium]
MSQPDSHERFAELFRQHHARLFGYVLSLVHSVVDAQDIMQQASLTMWERFDGFEPGSDFFAWACSIARFKSLNWLKAERRRQRVFSDAVELEITAAYCDVDPIEVAERKEALYGCVEELPADQQKLLFDCYDQSRAVADVAEELGRTVFSVYGSLRNIRRKLADCVRSKLSKGVR